MQRYILERLSTESENFHMNPLKKIYCRIFQNVFKFALPFLPYRNPEIISSLKAVPDVLKKKKCKNVLIITDAGIHKLGLTDCLEKVLTDSNIPYILYDKTVANPTTVNVAEALELYHENNCQAIIGFGGGSSMDCAKAVGARVAKPHQSLAKMKGILKEMEGLPFEGYEIHMGETILDEHAPGLVTIENDSDTLQQGHPDGSQKENVYGCYVHGIFDSPEMSGGFLSALLKEKGYDPETVQAVDWKSYKEEQYDKLADIVRASLDMKEIYRIIGL
jgi:hypothetical protein